MTGSSALRKASLVGAFCVFLLWLSAAQAFCPVRRDLPIVTVQQVIDGDSIRLTDGRSVRLIGINAPEMGRQGRPAEAFAEAARQRLAGLIEASAGQLGLLLGDRPRDRYGRTLAHLYDRDGNNIEAQLLADGLAYWVAVPPNLELLDCLQAAEQQARTARRGLWWQPQTVSPGAIHKSGFMRIRGQVRQVVRNRGGVWLEMEGPLVLHIAPQAQTLLDRQWLQSLQGNRVIARGWVVERPNRPVDRARWMLPVTHPLMLTME